MLHLFVAVSFLSVAILLGELRRVLPDVSVSAMSNIERYRIPL